MTVFEAAIWVKSVYVINMRKIVIEKLKGEIMEIEESFLHKCLSKRWFRKGIHSLL